MPAGRLRPAGADADPARAPDALARPSSRSRRRRASPFASSLLFDYVATYMYEDDTPPEERRAQALSLDRDLLRELHGHRGAARAARPGRDRARSSRRCDRRRATSTSCTTCCAARGAAASTASTTAGSPRRSLRERRAIRVRLGASELLVAIEDAGARPRRVRRRAAGRSAAGLPRAGRGRARAPCSDGTRRRMARSRRAEVAARFQLDAAAVDAELVALELTDALVRGELRPGGSEREWCDPGRPAPHPARDARRAAARGRARRSRRRSAASFPRGTGSAADRACARRSFRCRDCALPATLWESDVLPRRVSGFRPRRPGRRSCAVGRGRLGRCRARPRRVVLPRRRATPRPAERRCRTGRRARPQAAPRRAAAAIALLGRSRRGHRSRRGRRSGGALGARLGGRGDERLLGSAAGCATLRRTTTGSRRTADSHGRDATSPSPTQGAGRSRQRSSPGSSDRRALAELLLERQGIVTRDGVRGEGIRGGYGAVYAELKALETLGVCRRGYFVEGLGGAQFALPGAVERLRELRASAVGDEPEALVLAAADPAQPYGAALPWPRRVRRSRRARRRGVDRPPRRRGGALRRARRALARAASRSGSGLAPSRTCGARRARESAAARSVSRSSASTASPWRRPTSCSSSSRPGFSPGRGGPCLRP